MGRSAIAEPRAAETTPVTRSTKGSHIFRTPFLKCFGGAFRYLFHRMGQKTTSARAPIPLFRRVRRRPVQVYRLSSFLPPLFLPAHPHIRGAGRRLGPEFQLALPPSKAPDRSA